jgi:Domain of unknown function (DUF5655)/Domain of unknown function (DUF4287)
MADPNAALATQLRNIEARTGKGLAELRKLVAASGLGRHAQVRAMLMETLGLGYGDANTLAHAVAKGEAAPAQDAADPLDAIYVDAKAALRPLHEKMVAAIAAWGAFESAPKKGYVSLRRKKQFAMLGPATRTQIEIGLNARELPADPRLKALPPGGMCQYTVRVAQASEIDAQLLGWVRTAFDAAG